MVERLVSFLLTLPMLFPIGAQCGEGVPEVQVPRTTTVVESTEITDTTENSEVEEDTKWVPLMLVLSEDDTTGEEVEVIPLVLEIYEETEATTETLEVEEVAENTETEENTEGFLLLFDTLFEELPEEERAKYIPQLLDLTEETTVEETEETETTEATEVTEAGEVTEETEATETEEVTETTEPTDAEEETEVTEATDIPEEEELVETIEIEEEEEIPEETTAADKYGSYHTGKLTVRKGVIYDSPCGGSETWYPDAPVGAVKIMERDFGFTDLKMTVREDGVRIISGTRPNGETFSDLVVVAGDIYHQYYDPDGTCVRGQLVETSLGTGIYVDWCERAMNERKANGHIHIDIAVAW